MGGWSNEESFSDYTVLWRDLARPNKDQRFKMFTTCNDQSKIWWAEVVYTLTITSVISSQWCPINECIKNLITYFLCTVKQFFEALEY